MTIGEMINHYGENHTPYIGGLVNHLPMGQLAVYKMTDDLDKVKNFTDSFLERSNLDQVQIDYPNIYTIEEALGNRSLYEACLYLLKEEVQNTDMDKYIKRLINKYILGISSGLFHTIIRVAYAIEGAAIDPVLNKEIERALAYYVTAYRESKLFTREIQGSMIKEEMDSLVADKHLQDLLSNYDSLGKKIQALYNEIDFQEKGFIIEGKEDEKIKALLDLLVPAYYFSGNIVILHCITGLHAVIEMKDYFDDYSLALDILTTSIITHLLTLNYYNYSIEIDDFSHISWEAIISVGSEQNDVHAVKLCHSAYELDKLYDVKGLKDIVIKRIRY